MDKVLRDKKAIFLMAFPVFAIFILFIPIPVLISTFLSLTEWNGIGDIKYIGLKNYEFLFFKDWIFEVSMVNTLKWMLGGLILQLVPAFFLAVILSRKLRARGFYRSVLFMPSTFSSVSVSLIWYFIYHPEIGIINQMIRFFGVEGFNHAWLMDKRFALIGVLISVAWQWVGYYVVIFLSGITGIPDEIIEAAEIDGASSLQVLRHILLPYLMPMIKVATVLATTSAFKGFGQVYVMTGGGPNKATTLLALHMYNKIFAEMKYGYGSTISVVIMVLCIVSSQIINKVFDRKSIEE